MKDTMILKMELLLNWRQAQAWEPYRWWRLIGRHGGNMGGIDTR